MRRLLVGVLATMLFAAGGVVTASAVGVPEADPSAGSFTGSYNFTPASSTSPCAGEDGGIYVYDRISIKATSVDSTGGDFSLTSATNGMTIVGTMVFNQATNNGWARGTIAVVNLPTKITGPFTAVLGPDAAGTGFQIRGLWTGTVRVSGALTGDITIENFEFNTPTTTAGALSAGSWGGTPSNSDLSVKTKTATC
jgi:hypothetical protein